MTIARKNPSRRLVLCAALMASLPAAAQAGSLQFFESSQGDYDYGRQNSLPAGFGTGEFTLELWVRLDNSFAVGSTASGTGQRQNWSTSNDTPYSKPSWWWGGNFLLDGHNNENYSNGTFSLQVFNGGRLRWLFGDGSPASQRSGGLHAVQNGASASLLDGNWHQVTLVRRANGAGATLEMWIDGTLIDTENSSAMPDMRTWWNNWPGYSANQAGWFWGVEKQAALGVLSQYEDYKGNIDELRFWSRAKSAADIGSSYGNAVTGAEIGLAGRFAFEGSACNQVGDTNCITPVNLKPGAWSSLSAPLGGSVADATAPTTPTNLRSTSTLAGSVALAWNASTDNVVVATYRITRNGTTVTSSVTGTSHTDAGLLPATLYSYTVTAVDTSGNVSPAATLQATTPGATDTQAPSVPANLRSTATQSTSVALAWNASTDDQGVSGYSIYRGAQLAGTTTSLTFTDSTVAGSTSYSYTVAARDAAGNLSAQSVALLVTTPATPPATDTAPPSVPASLRATSIQPTTIGLAWNASVDNTAVASYRISRNGTVLNNALTGTTFSDSGLQPGTLYTYSVSAVDASGNRSAQATLQVATCNTSTWRGRRACRP